MPIAGRKRFGEIDLHAIEKFATKAGTDPDRLVQRTRDMAAALPDAITTAAADIPPEILGDLAATLKDRVAHLCTTLDRPPRTPIPTAEDDPPPPADDNNHSGEIAVVSYSRGKHAVRTHTRRRPSKPPLTADTL